MSERILVTYATRFGSTTEIAKAIAAILRREGLWVEVRALEDVEEIDPYRTVILGSAIRDGKWLPEALDFLQVHHAALSQMPVAYFTVCMTLREDTPENRRIVYGYHDSILRDHTDISPVSIGMFAGAVDTKKFSAMLRLMSLSSKIPQGDWRDWEEIENWARSLVPLLRREVQPL